MRAEALVFAALGEPDKAFTRLRNYPEKALDIDRQDGSEMLLQSQAAIETVRKKADIGTAEEKEKVKPLEIAST